MVQFTQLPADVIDQILASLPDFQSLSAAIRVSKQHVYAVFKNHRRTILTSVALNVVGPALPHAIRVAIWQATGGPDEPVDLDYDESLKAATEFLASLDREHRRYIEENAAAIQKLEDVFSQTYKDRRLITSVLTEAESLRFRIALYRLWLFCFSIQQMPDDPEDPEEQWGEWDCNWRALVVRLAKYETQDLLDIIAAARFLQEVLRWVMTENFPENGSITHEFPLPNRVGNPGLVHEWLQTPYTWKELSSEYQYELSASMLKVALEDVCVSKNLNIETTLTASPQRMVTKVYGTGDKCFGCNEVHGKDLYGRPNWGFLGGVIGIQPIKRSLPGLLTQNIIELNSVTDYFAYREDFTWSAFIEQVFDVDLPDDDGIVWDKEQWYCKACITKLLTTRFFKWWAIKPMDAMPPPKKNCWYGWNCRTQVHNWAHVMKLNHFCEPIRGDTNKTPGGACAQAQNTTTG